MCKENIKVFISEIKLVIFCLYVVFYCYKLKMELYYFLVYLINVFLLEFVSVLIIFC